MTVLVISNQAADELSECDKCKLIGGRVHLAGGPNAVRAQIPRPVKGRHGFGAPATTLCAIHPVRPRCLDVTSLVLCPRLLQTPHAPHCTLAACCSPSGHLQSGMCLIYMTTEEMLVPSCGARGCQGKSLNGASSCSNRLMLPGVL